MILTRMGRSKALVVVFVASLLFTTVTMPIVAVPALIEEPRRLGEMLSSYGGYLLGLVSLDWLGRVGTGEWWILAALLCGWSGLTVAFLAPIVGPPAADGAGRSLRSSVIAASILGACMCGLLMAALVEGALAAMAGSASEFTEIYRTGLVGVWTMALVAWCVSGFGWMYFLRRAGRSRDPKGLDRLLRLLLSGTVVELALGLPIYALARKKYDCYCAMATFLNLMFGVAALLWMCGPWVVLLLTRRARVNWARTICGVCGYPRRTGATRCTECGDDFGA